MVGGDHVTVGGSGIVTVNDIGKKNVKYFLIGAVVFVSLEIIGVGKSGMLDKSAIMPILFLNLFFG